jgi:transcriptional activator SPT7
MDYYIFRDDDADFDKIMESAYYKNRPLLTGNIAYDSATDQSDFVNKDEQLIAFQELLRRELVISPHDSGHFSTLSAVLPWRLKFLLKHLGLIEQASGEEIFNLIMEARPHRSKWFDPNRIGQVELYEALDKVLSELKSFMPHSAPFLQRVSKKQVPDYYKIIDNPMDLGTMSKKLKNKEYNSKEEFLNDLELIHSNCFTYNTDETSAIRKSSSLLREKWLLLMHRVPDIYITSTSAMRGISKDETASFEIDEQFTIPSDGILSSSSISCH